MKRLFVLAIVLMFSATAWAGDNDGLISKKSRYSVKVTLDRLEKNLRSRGFTIVVRWNHGKRGNKAGFALRPTELLLFGNPKIGSHLLSSNPTAGIDLPMKALAWKDENGQVWLSYNDPQYIADRHGITELGVRHDLLTC